MFQGSSRRYIKAGLRTYLCRPRFLEVLGSIEFSKVPLYDYTKEKPRGRQSPIDGSYYSWGYIDEAYNAIDVFKPIIIEHRDKISAVLGADFHISPPTFWRTTHMPVELQHKDIYSQVFHQDSVYDQYNIQIFLLLEDVSEVQGPFEWVSRQYHRKAFRHASKRDQILLPSNVRINKLVGLKGDYLVLSTGYSIHRDGIPEHGRSRRLCSIGLFPSYTKIGNPIAKYLQT